ncbi:molecular chaperone [Providencia stuartii]|uniref:fimbrial biogenesis chaperone n=1 Tax=Providencia stuartii TaxID=588 RepID=UPI000CE65CCA|nr:molecular chaperone [Providencia stuartii]AVE43321.1 molecular chaperone [Providencia stuartii]
MKKIIFSAVFLLFSISHFASAAGVSVGGTRFIYQENKREIDIPIFNSDKEKPFLIQTWVSPFEGEGKTPFIATPPLFRIEPDSNAAARISYVGEPIGSNQEKLYLLNVKSIPPKDVKIENQLQIVINSQFKLFLRSKDIVPFDFNKVEIIKKPDGIIINYDTPYHLSVRDILVDGKNIQGGDLVYPHTKEYIVKHSINNNQKVVVKFINDYGAIIDKTSK